MLSGTLLLFSALFVFTLVALMGSALVIGAALDGDIRLYNNIDRPWLAIYCWAIMHSTVKYQDCQM